MTYRTAVIGAGRIGLLLEQDSKRRKPSTHAGMWSMHAATDLVALCDSDPDLEKVAIELVPGAKYYTDPQVMLSAERPEIVSIATQHDSHIELARLAILSGAKAIFCEKPISHDFEAASKLIEQAEAAGVHFFVNHARRFDPLLRRLTKELADDLIGELIQVTGYYVYGLISTGTHLVDLLRMTLGPREGEIVWVTGWFNERGVYHPEDDPCIDGILCFESGLKAFIQSLDMRSYGEASTRTGFRDLSRVPTDSWTNLGNSYFEFAAENIIDCLEDRVVPFSTGRDSLQALTVLRAMSDSAKADGLRVSLPLG